MNSQLFHQQSAFHDGFNQRDSPVANWYWSVGFARQTSSRQVSCALRTTQICTPSLPFVVLFGRNLLLRYHHLRSIQQSSQDQYLNLRCSAEDQKIMSNQSRYTSNTWHLKLLEEDNLGYMFRNLPSRSTRSWNLCEFASAPGWGDRTLLAAALCDAKTTAWNESIIRHQTCSWDPAWFIDGKYSLTINILELSGSTLSTKYIRFPFPKQRFEGFT